MLEALSGMPSLSGGDAGPSSSDGIFEGSDFRSKFSSPFIFGGSGKGVNTAITGWVIGGVLVVVVIVGFLAWRSFKK